MIVYGDHDQRHSTESLISNLAELCRSFADASTDVARHTAATRLLIDAGGLMQGLCDFQFANRGYDEMTPLALCGAELVAAAARVFCRTYDRSVGRNHPAGPVELHGALQRLAVQERPDEVDVRLPEGYACYAVYPELFLEAARLLCASCDLPTVTVGVRSIGTSLGAVVGVGLGGGRVPLLTLRPKGAVFDRHLAIGPRMKRVLRAFTPRAMFAVVDEGPGLSGSSIACAVEELDSFGADPERIHVLPGHPGMPGPHATPRVHARWSKMSRTCVAFDDVFLAGPGRWLMPWVDSDRAHGVLDASAGRWRAYLCTRMADWPPANPTQERRKYLYRDSAGLWLAKFAGLTAEAEESVAELAALGQAGLTPPVRDFRHGFVVQPWQVGAQPLTSIRGTVDREFLVRRVADYVSFRASRRGCGQISAGAPPKVLLSNARLNTREAIGEEAARTLDAWRDKLAMIADAWQPGRTDNRLQAWEWLLTADGRILKTDAVDHPLGHDYVGAQDVAWDIAGADVGFEFTPAELELFFRRLANAGCRPPTTRLHAFYRLCYLGFQVGYWAHAAKLAGACVDEQTRLKRTYARYVARLLEAIKAGAEATPRMRRE